MSALNTIKFYLKSVVFGSVIAGCAIYGIFASLILRIINKLEYAQFTVARAFYYGLGTTLGLKINIKNEHYLRGLPAICVSNHQSALDVYILGRIFQPGYTVTSKSSLKYVPFLGWFMSLSGTFFLDRKKGAKAKAVLEGALNDLKREKKALFIFPEGTRSATTELEMLPFKKGAFHLAKDAGIPIIPVVVSNTSTLFSSKKKTFRGGEITIEVLPPVPTTDVKTHDDVTKLVNKVRDDMVSTLKRIGYSKPSGGEEEDDDEEVDSDISSIDTKFDVIPPAKIIVEAD
ncbi:uncharacterized protein SPAPADRAFT_141322 [Spathaspora passalidarum NRRL Y-27907]|uniref:1-acyl-sn-glycerol-3-phosphate acyltransferase n=1 Tax=Spathaspora passalidarum (strain NRRL Y-27907 / 11-Y1) TaxID=619300 RepID=G3AQF7_SPAPN|nr:uncharacterized protein SPAPADRAFT_141322 [Spathaspora passalidarum NRRL Y-27907]EGW31505.1 hypothetical protein SPAPADRAFT_141322 [Spathaspora passalidarum NRRL Y-27907]